MHLKPRSDRKELATEIIERLRPQVAMVPGIEVYMQNPPTVRIGGQVSKSLYQFSMQSPDRDALYATARQDWFAGTIALLTGSVIYAIMKLVRRRETVPPAAG